MYLHHSKGDTYTTSDLEELDFCRRSGYCRYLYVGNRHGNGGVGCVAQLRPGHGNGQAGCLQNSVTCKKKSKKIKLNIFRCVGPRLSLFGVFLPPRPHPRLYCPSALRYPPISDLDHQMPKRSPRTIVFSVAPV
jgi:hypothetical protein